MQTHVDPTFYFSVPLPNLARWLYKIWMMFIHLVRYASPSGGRGLTLLRHPLHVPKAALHRLSDANFEWGRNVRGLVRRRIANGRWSEKTFTFTSSLCERRVQNCRFSFPQRAGRTSRKKRRFLQQLALTVRVSRVLINVKWRLFVTWRERYHHITVCQVVVTGVTGRRGGCQPADPGTPARQYAEAKRGSLNTSECVEPG